MNNAVISSLYRVNLVVVQLGLILVVFDLHVPPSRPAAQPILSNSQLPKQNQVENGTPRIQVKPTKVSDHQIHPVLKVRLRSGIYGTMLVSGALVAACRPDIRGGGRDADHLPVLLAVPLRPALPHRHVRLPLRAAALHHGARLAVFRLVRSGRISNLLYSAGQKKPWSKVVSHKLC